MTDDRSFPGDWTDRHQRALDAALQAALDTEAGLNEILLQSHHDACIEALDTVLDTEAGLAAILSPTSPPVPRLTRTDAGHQAPDPTQKIIRSVSPARRIALRRHPDLTTATRLLSRAVALAADPRRTWSGVRSLALDIVLELARCLPQDMTAAGPRSIELSLDQISCLDRTRDLYDDLWLSHPRDNPQDLYLARDRARDLVLIFTMADELDNNPALTRAHARGRDVVFVLDGIRRGERLREDTADHACAVSSDLTRVCIREISRTIGQLLGADLLLFNAASLGAFLDDFTKADLRTANLAGTDLIGVLWSENTTLWPGSIDVEHLKARSESVPHEQGVWVVRSDQARTRDPAERNA
ncbi:hypothetical protein GCM10011579_092590 [Streptomyces albiflavescens]|uniref:Pentapeptide repeat-containing protein n=1 Tax=Streptomyces albiflavescens TaxID=1623582 RepID=A0A917YHD0_9ACTN|nr:hypothetical protein [Streptomyces albiflavescens]GGN93779.1 hypothetical protein GCM10011579_092590 [Streptomyces albiflavescens]